MVGSIPCPRDLLDQAYLITISTVFLHRKVELQKKVAIVFINGSHRFVVYVHARHSPAHTDTTHSNPGSSKHLLRKMKRTIVRQRQVLKRCNTFQITAMIITKVQAGKIPEHTRSTRQMKISIHPNI